MPPSGAVPTSSNGGCPLLMIPNSRGSVRRTRTSTGRFRPRPRGCSSAWCGGDGVPARRPESSAEVKDWTKDQRDTWDDLGQFFQECCQQEQHQDNPVKYALRVAASDLHDAYCIWYAENKDKRYSISAKAFAQLLNKKDIDVVRSNGTWRLGIDLKPEWKDRIAQRRAEEEAKKKRNLSGNVR